MSKKIECSLCGEKSENVHSVYYKKNDEITDYCEDCEDVYIEILSRELVNELA